MTFAECWAELKRIAGPKTMVTLSVEAEYHPYGTPPEKGDTLTWKAFIGSGDHGEDCFHAYHPSPEALVAVVIMRRGCPEEREPAARAALEAIGVVEN